MITSLPSKTIERLSQYRRLLFNCLSEGKQHIYSRELALLMHITSVQVRRDLMLIGYSGSQGKGYHIPNLIASISSIIDTPGGQKVVVIGVGNLGKAIINYLVGKRTQLSIVGAFDVNKEKIGCFFSDIPCYSIERLPEIIKKEKVMVGIITVPAEAAVKVSETLIASGIKGVLNFSPAPLKVPINVYLEEYDIVTSLEKVAFFSKQNQ